MEHRFLTPVRNAELSSWHSCALLLVHRHRVSRASDPERLERALYSVVNGLQPGQFVAVNMVRQWQGGREGG